MPAFFLGPDVFFLTWSSAPICDEWKRFWCPGPDSNRHGSFRRRGILSPLCLPVSPPGPTAILAARARGEGGDDRAARGRG